MAGIEAGVYVQELNEAANEESGSDEKDQRQGDFADDQQTAQAIVGNSAGRTATTFLEEFSERLAPRSEGGCEAEEQSSQQRNGKRETEDAQIQ
jgi:hypothetical protein